MKIVFCTTCKHRGAHLKLTLPKNMADNPKSHFVVLDYGDSKELSDVFKSLHSDRLSIYRFEADKFHMAHAKNMAARLAIRKGADIIVTLDADNYTGQGFEDFIESEFEKFKGIFLCPLTIGHGHHSIRIRPRGVAGRLVIRAQDFIKAGGYDEKFDTWHGEDVDIVARLRRIGFHPRPIPKRYLNAITHLAGLRFKEYPGAQELYENDEVVQRISNEKHRIVNYGKIGCGTVSRRDKSRITLEPIPTRIFGIGFQRTGTTSLAKAFEIFGFDTFHFESGDKARDIWEEMKKYGSSPMLERYYALCDSPIPILYQQLDKAYPNSKFILTVREECGWLSSIQWLFSYKNPERWTWDKWPISNRLHEVMYGRCDFNKKAMLSAYRKHNKEVIEYFEHRPNDLLVIETNEPSLEKLAKFLGQTVPEVPYPWLGKGQPEPEKVPFWQRLRNSITKFLPLSFKK